MKEGSIASLLSHLPHRPGVYKFKDTEGRILYVGKAKDLKKRVQSYFRKQLNRPARTQKLIEQTHDLEWTEVGSDWEALMLETNWIKEFRPKYNVLMKDDKNFVYIKISKNEDFPRIEIVRKVVNDGARYFGPKTSAHQVKKTLILLQKLFKFRTCDLDIKWEGDRVEVTHKTIAYPCLLYHIKRCDAPCIAKVKPEDYQMAIQKIEWFLEGKTDEIEEGLKGQIQECINTKSFERAAQLRDKLLAVQDLMKQQRVTTPKMENIDLIGFVIDQEEAYFSHFQLRAGKIVNQENFVLKAAGFQSGDEVNAPEVLESFLYQYYERAVDIPGLILTPIAIEEEDFFTQWLEQRRELGVELRYPQRGDKRELMDLAEKNARSFLKQHRARFMKSEDEAQGGVELQKALGILKPLKRIECYDISHLGGTDTVASMVVFLDGVSAPQHYRKFKLKTIVEGEIDDFKSMNEILNRRLSHIALPKSLTIKKATKKSMESIQALYKEWRSEESSEFNVSDFYVAYHDENPVGMIRLQKQKERAVLQSLYVTPSMRGQGYSAQLLKTALKREKITRLYVRITEESVAFYENIGFKPIHQFPKEFEEFTYKHDAPTSDFVLEVKKQSDLSFDEKPDLIVIDGGKGQLSSAMKALSSYEVEIPMIGLAKREEDVYLPEKSLPVLLPKDSKAIYLLQRIRNEAHRFAITFQRDSRKKHITHSVLDEIQGIGKIGKMKLLKRFGSLEGVIAANQKDLETVVNRATASKVYEWCRKWESNPHTPRGTGF